MPSMTEITCACGCGRKKEVRVADVKRGWGKYFSKSCKAIAQNRSMPYTTLSPLARRDTLTYSKKMSSTSRTPDLLAMLERKSITASVHCIDDDYYSDEDLADLDDDGSWDAHKHD